MPLKPGAKNLEANFHELRHGKQFARTRKEHGTETARAQMVAIALKEARKHRASGGKLMVGPIKGDAPGRTDVHEAKVPDGSYILSADVISHLGANNTDAGLKVANHLFGPGGKYDPGEERNSGGRTGRPVDCILAGGEFSILPRVVKNIGHGDIDAGHKILDHWSMQVRKDHIEVLKRLPPPARD